MSRDEEPHNDTPENRDDGGQDEAARKLQKLWRGKNEAKDQYLTPHARWDEVVGDTSMKAAGDGAGRGDNSQRERWGRAGKFVMRLQDPNAMMAGAGTDVPDAARKNLETQHWLELIDGKHRYGSNMKYYFAKWKEADTEENFFHWLDEGGGKDLDLKECSREQLEKERITYLTNEQRLNYLVKIDDKGRLHWAKNNELVDTSAGQWKDAGEGGGIVPLESEDHPELEEQEGGLSSPDSLAVNHYVEPPNGSSKLSTSIKRNFTVKGLVNKLLRKTLQKNTWIYVADKNYNIFIGIKKPGTFQHSSFLAGGKVTSAGLITVKEGVIHTLSPLSGHYRTSINHFHQFLDVLNQKGVDTSHVQKTKAEVALWTLEHIAKTKKKKSTVMNSAKEAAKSLVPHKSGGDDEDDDESEDSEEDKALKREILFGRKKEEEKRQAESAEDKARKKGAESKSNPAAERSRDDEPNAQAAEESSAHQEVTSQDGDAAADPPSNPEPPAEDQAHAQQDEARGDADSSLRANASTEPSKNVVPPSSPSPREDTVPSPQPDQAHAQSDV